MTQLQQTTGSAELGEAEHAIWPKLMWIVVAIALSAALRWFCLGVGLGGWQWPQSLDEITMDG